MPRRPLTRGEQAVVWIETWCITPGGQGVRLASEERATLYKIYDAGLPELAEGRLAAYLSLLHLCGPEARTAGELPRFATDIFSLWNAASPELRVHLRRHGDVISCPQLGTVWSAAA
jgi:hypothetical protein